MLVGQITDIHVGYERGNREEGNVLRLRQVIDRLCNGPNRPDLLLLTGDLTEHGDAESYAVLAEELRACAIACHAIPGNHDRREALAAAFPPPGRMDQGFIQYAIETAGLRMLFLDTLEEGRHGIAFCAARAAWLTAELERVPDQPVLIVMHHPPFDSGIEWMDPPPGSQAIARFHAAVAPHRDRARVISGHLHRVIHANREGVSMMSAPSIAPPVGLDLRPLDVDAPDHRALITREPPGYALHRWDGMQLVSHVEFIEGLDPLAELDAQRRDKLRPILDQRGDPS